MSGSSDRDPLFDAPVRLCCGERHLGAVCPDDKVMCCLCFLRFPVSELNVTKTGPEDVCLGCATQECRRICAECGVNEDWLMEDAGWICHHCGAVS